MKPKMTPEFFRWAAEHGLPPRGPRGSPQNKERGKVLSRLWEEWLKGCEERRKEHLERFIGIGRSLEKIRERREHDHTP